MQEQETDSFRWSVSCGMLAFGKLAGVPLHRLFQEAKAIIEAYSVGAPRARDLFGPEVGVGGPMWAGISYGHTNALGCELRFPEDSEVGVRPLYGTLDEGIEALQEKVDFAQRGMIPFYLNLWEELKQAFPDRRIPFGGLAAEGPITTAWILRGHDFFSDLYDAPEQTQRFLRLVTDSVVEYKNWMASVNGQPGFSTDGAGVCDDVAAMISPTLWPHFVMPYLERYFRAVTSGRRSAHIEDLTVQHLPFLDELELTSFDPSVSPRLTPALFRDHCSVSFSWRLNAMQLRDLNEAQIKSWVRDAARDGAASVFYNIEAVGCTDEGAAKVKAFIRAAKHVQQRLTQGHSRAELAS